jgi:hypothetical protein
MSIPLMEVPRSIREAWTNFKHWETVQQWKEADEDIDRSFVLSLSPSVFKPKWGGRYLYTDGCFIQVISIGDPSPVNPGRQGIPYRKSLRIMDDILDIPVGDTSCIMVTQTAIPLPANDEQDALREARRINLITKTTQEYEADENGDVKIHDRILDYVGEGIEAYNRAVYEGETRLFEFSLLVAVKGKTTKDVDDTMSMITALMDGKRIIYEIIEHDQVDAYLSMLPTPYIKSRLLSTTTGNIVALTTPLRNKNPKLADSGRFMGIDERTNNPIFLNFHNGSLVSGHSLVVGKSGSGKSTELLKDDKRALEDGDEAFHIVPKADQDTNHKRVCIEMGGQLIDIGNGEGKCNFNFFQVFYDKSRMEDSISARQTAYARHINILTDSIGLLIGKSFSDPQRNWTYTSLLELYRRFKVIDGEGNVINTDRWEDGNFWPNFEDWRDLLWEWMNDDKHKPQSINSIISALYNNTVMITRLGPFGFLINNNALKLDNRFTMVDISSLLDTPNIQDAVILMVTGIINTKIQCRPEGAEKKHIFITLDEGANLVKIPRMRRVIEKMFRELRSFGGHLKIVFQDLAGVPPSMIHMMKTNTDYILLMSNMAAYNVKPLVKEFNLTKSDIRRLKTPGQGRGVFIIGDAHIDYVNSLTDDEERVIFDKVPEAKRTARGVDSLIKLDERVEWIRRNHGVFVKNWIVNKPLDQAIKAPGYNWEQLEPPFKRGKGIIYIREGLENKDSEIEVKTFDEKEKKIKIKNQSKDHYKFVYSLAGELCLMDFDVTPDDYGRRVLMIDSNGKAIIQRVDLVAKKKIQASEVEICIALEVEMPKSHTVEQLQKKRDEILALKCDGKPVFDAVIFTCDNKYWKAVVKDAVGEEHSAPRGEQLKNKIMEIIETKIQATACENKEEQIIQDSANPAESVLYSGESELMEAQI